MDDGREPAAAERAAVRAHLAGQLDVVDAAEQADLSVSAFLDLIDRLRAADAAVRSDGAASEPPQISVVIPVYDEEGNLAPLLEELIPVLRAVGTYEVVFVDDGSTDRS
ncbi:MAG: glycosyltransferase, partial [Aquihabitans sp.]